jgi:8-amino-3,8-dideoxy-alpha-D-manno-octulosonate transaminase
MNVFIHSKELPMNHRTNRRSFLETAGAFGAASLMAAAARPSLAADPAKLAVDGGAPVRKTPLRTGPYGPQYYDDVEKQGLIDVLESKSPFRWKGADSKVLQFERAYASLIGVKYAVGVTSGTTALYTAMAALEIGPGDEVILPAWTWFADYDAIALCGGLPVFAEIDESFAIDPKDIEARITPRTKAIIACHLQGVPADMDAIMAIAKKHNLRVVEDSAQCCGGQYKGKFVGSIGDIGINSFQQSKTITAGEGGCVTTNDPKLFERALRFHDVAALRPPYSESLKGGVLPGFVSCNFRMNEFTGAVLLGQVQKLATICKNVRANAAKVRQAIADVPGLKLRKSHDVDGDIGSGVFIDLGTGQRRAKYLRAMAAEGVPASPPGGSVILPSHKWIEAKATIHPAWPSFTSEAGKAIRYGAEACPRTIDIIGRFAGVAMGPKYTDDDTRDAAQAIRKVFTAMGPA